MIKVILEDYEFDLSNLGITVVEKNNMFRDQITKNFSYPFPVILTPEIAVHFGIADINNITSYKTKIPVKVLENNQFYDGYLKVTRIVGQKATTTLYYGHEVLEVYNKSLNTLPFVKEETTSIFTHAKTQTTKQWPEVGYNFVTIIDEEFSKKTDYSYFDGFINNTDTNGDYTQNTIITVDGEQVVANNNVLSPMPYLMELLKVGYETENKVMQGSFVDDAFNHKIVCLSDDYLEQFSTSELDVSSFDLPTLNYVFEQVVYSLYEKIYNSSLLGSYDFFFSVNLTKVQASYFKITVKHGDTVLYFLESQNQAVDIKETIAISKEAGNLSENITIEMVLLEQTESIKSQNFLKFEYKETKLNISGDSFDLSDFVPNVTFRELVNFVENFFNVDIDVTENIVYINYIDEVLPALIYDDHSKYEIPEPKRDVNKEKIFGLKYDDGSELYINKDGIIPSVNAALQNEVVTIDVPVIPLTTATKSDKKTAVNSTESTSFKLCLYNGLQNSMPLAVASINDRGLTIQDLYLKWESWLKVRTNSELYEDTFNAHVSERFSVNRGLIKYNKKHIVKEIQKKSINKNYNKVTLKFESF